MPPGLLLPFTSRNVQYMLVSQDTRYSRAALGGACCHHIGARGVSLQEERGERGRC